MPRKPKRPCSFPGCPRLTEGRFCEEHGKQENRRYEKYDRDPAVRRRYGRAWKRIRDRYAASTRSVRSARRKDCCGRWRKYTISYHWQRAGRMTRETLCHCASPAMRGFMRSVETDGISVNVSCAGPL